MSSFLTLYPELERLLNPHIYSGTFFWPEHLVATLGSKHNILANG